MTKTDVSGRFEIKALASETYQLTLHPPGASRWWVAELDNVSPGGSEIVLIGDCDDFPTAFIHGRLLDARGAPLLTRIWASHAMASGAASAEQSADGHFRIGLLQRGDVTLSIELGLTKSTKRVIANLAAREDRDLGDIVVP